MMRCGSWRNIYTKWIDAMPNFSRLLITFVEFTKSANFIFSRMTWFWGDFIGLAVHEESLDLCDLEKDPLARPTTRARGVTNEILSRSQSNLVFPPRLRPEVYPSLLWRPGRLKHPNTRATDMDCICLNHYGSCIKSYQSYLSRFYVLSFYLSACTVEKLRDIKQRSMLTFPGLSDKFGFEFSSSAVDKIFLLHTLSVRKEGLSTCILDSIECRRVDKIARSFFDLNFDQVLELLLQTYHFLPRGKSIGLSIQYSFNLGQSIGKKIIQDQTDMVDCRILIVAIRKKDKKVIACYCD